MTQYYEKLTARQFSPLVALMLGYAFLMLAGGLNSLIIPVRGSMEGFSTFSLGLLGTSWAIGFILGSIYVPGLVSRVGHIRIFGVMASLATLAVLLSVILIHPIIWVPLRAAAGFCFAGAAMIVEAWINERTTSATRGRVLSVYTMVNLVATTTGQMLLVTGDANGFFFFLICGIFYTLAILPPSLSEQTRPSPLRKVTFNLPQLWKNSPVAVVGITLIGISNGAFGTLGAVFGERIDLNVATIATFMSVAILTGAIVQVPIGVLSDRFDRRLILVSVALIAATVDYYFLSAETFNTFHVLVAGAILGGAIYVMPPIVVSHANDFSPKDQYLQTSSGLLMLYGCGAIAGPLIAGTLMEFLGPRGLFAATLWAHLTIIIYASWRMVRRRPVKKGQKTRFERFDPGRVVMHSNTLTEFDFGLEEENERKVPEIPERILSSFAKPPSNDTETDLQKGRARDDSHDGW